MKIKNDSGLDTFPDSLHIEKENSNPMEIIPKWDESMSGNEGKKLGILS